MPDSKPVTPLVAVAFLALSSGCGEKLGYFLEYGNYRFHCSHDGVVDSASVSGLYDAPFFVRLPTSPERVVSPSDMTENELTELATSITNGFDGTPEIYDLKWGQVVHRQGKRNSGSFYGYSGNGSTSSGIAVAKSRNGPFVTLPSTEREIRKVFGKPNRISQGSQPFH